MKNLVTALVLATSFAAFADDAKPAAADAKPASSSTKKSSSSHKSSSKKSTTPAKPAADKPADAPAAK
jgi:hypothetical protein